MAVGGTAVIGVGVIAGSTLAFGVSTKHGIGQVDADRGPSVDHYGVDTWDLHRYHHIGTSQLQIRISVGGIDSFLIHKHLVGYISFGLLLFQFYHKGLILNSETEWTRGGA